MMKRVCVVCEGQSEETVVRTVISPALHSSGINLSGQTIQTSPGHKGGGLSYARVRNHIKNTLCQHSAPVVTTFFDLYALPTDFPGYAAAQKKSSYTERLKCLEDEFHKDIINATGCRSERFIPYIQPHELEALLFSDVSALVSIEPKWNSALSSLQAVLSRFSPEEINDGVDTKPSARLERLLSNPSYKKKGNLRHASIAAEKIGLAKIEAACPHFANWLTKLRSISVE